MLGQADRFTLASYILEFLGPNPFRRKTLRKLFGLDRKYNLRILIAVQIRSSDPQREFIAL